MLAVLRIECDIVGYYGSSEVRLAEQDEDHVTIHTPAHVDAYSAPSGPGPLQAGDII